MNYDNAEHSTLFIEDAMEQMSLMDEAFVKLERNPQDKEVLDLLFRITHTLKGNAGSMGLDNIARLSHSMENVLDELRCGALILSGEMMDCLFKGMDSLRLLLNRYQSSGDDDIDIQDILDELIVLSGADERTSGDSKNELSSRGLMDILSELEIEDVKNRIAQGSEAYLLKIRYSDSVMMTDVKTIVIMNEIKNYADIIKCVPDPEGDGSENESFNYEILLEAPPESKSKLLTMEHSEIESLEIENVRELLEEHLADAQDRPSSKETAKPAMAKAKAPADAPAGVSPAAASTSSVRVETARLDSIMNLVGELVTNRTRFKIINKQLLEMDELLDEPDAEVSPSMVREIIASFNNSFLLMTRVINELQDKMMKVRMLPIGSIFKKFERIVRDLSKQTGKLIELKITGGSVELDKTVVELIGDPLLHMVRNAIWHGIETPEERLAAGKLESGKLRLKAYYEGNAVKVEIRDDGRGIDHNQIRRKAVALGILTEEEAEKLSEKEALNLIFTPAISTEENVNDVSGRGVGMDIVANNIKAMNGVIDFRTKVGEGTTFILKLPITLAIFQAIVVRVGDEKYAISLVNITEIIRIKKSSVSRVEGCEVATVRNSVISLFRLQDILNVSTVEPDDDYHYVVVVGLAEKRVGLIVHELVGRQEIVIKNLGREFKDIQYISGASITGDGSVMLVLDIYTIIERSVNGTK